MNFAKALPPTSKNPTAARAFRVAFAIIPYLIVTVPVIAEVVRRAVSGWTPTSDDGAFAVNAHDVFTSHPTWLGAASTVGVTTGTPVFHVFHLGPLQWWALAIPERFFTQRMGMAIGAAIVVLASVIGIVRTARRLGGQHAALWAAVTVAATMWSVGHVTLAEPWNPYIALWPFAFCLVSGIELATGKVRVLPWFALAASFAVQCHYLFLVPIAATAFVSLTLFALQRFRWQRITSSPTRRAAITTAAVILFAWLPSIVQQVRGKPGNLGEWWRATRSLSQTHVPFAYATHYSVQTVGVVPLFARGPLGSSQLYFLGAQPSWNAQLFAAVVVAVVIAVAAFGVRRHSSRGAIQLVTLVALAATTLTISRYPATFPAFPHYRIVLLWPVSALTWFAVGAAIAAAFKQLKPSLGHWLSGHFVTGFGFATALALCAAAAFGATPAGPSTAVQQRATLRLTTQILQRLDRNKHYVVAATGMTGAFVQLGVLRELLSAGVHIGVSDTEVQLKSRYLVRDLHNVDRLVVASGTLTAPANTTTIARFDARRGDDQIMLQKRLNDLLAALRDHAPTLRPGLVPATDDLLLSAIAARKLTPVLAGDVRLWPMIATGDVRADHAFLVANGRYGTALNTVNEREFVVYLEPAIP